MEAGRSQTVPLLLWLLALHVVGLLIFTKGFLLTRVELDLYSGCTDFPTHHYSNQYTTEETCRLVEDASPDGASSKFKTRPDDAVEEQLQIPRRQSGCWSTPKVQKVVILIIDAMRFDFAANTSAYHQPTGPWVGRLPIFERLVAEKGASAALFKFVADPPTTSLQRLKGLTTGGLPTFIDIGNSFGAPAITEDNLISQLTQQGRRLVLLGDDTWMDLYPTQFTEAHPYPSFVVKDIHTVDNGVIKEIFPALERDDWDVLIGHFLGVDHVGHTFDVGSPVMLEKLDQMNAVIEDVVSALEKHSQGLHQDTLLIVMGDHAQTLSGDHGGGTPEEVDTALFALSMRTPPAALPSDLRSQPCTTSLSDPGPSRCATLPQVDFAPTLAMLLGVPIPYASVGKISPELWALCAHSWTEKVPPSDVSHSTPLNSRCQAAKVPPLCRNPSATNEHGTEKRHHVGSAKNQRSVLGSNAETGAESRSGGGSAEEYRCEHRSRSGEDVEVPISDEARLDTWLAGYLRALAVNSAQVQRYLDQYSAAATSPFPAAQLAKVRALHQKAIRAGGEVRHGAGSGFLPEGDSGRGGKETAEGMLLAGSETGDGERCQSREEELLADVERTRGSFETTGRRQGVCGAQTEGGETCRVEGTATSKNAAQGDGSQRREGESRLSALQRAIAAHLEHLTKAAELARAQWTQFDGAAMVLGLTILAASLLAHLIALLSLSSDAPPKLPWTRTVTVAAAVGTAKAAGISVSGGVNELVGDGVHALVMGAGAAALASVAVLSRHVLGSHVSATAHGTEGFGLLWRGRVGRRRDWGLLLFTCMHAASLISDNCIMAEGKIAVGLTALTAALYLRDAVRIRSRVHVQDALLLLAANAALAFLGLRSPSSQQRGTSAATLSPPLASILAALSTSVPLLLLFRLLSRHLPSKTRLWRAFQMCCALQYFLVAAYRLVEDLGDQFLLPPHQMVARLLLPRAVYGLAATLLATLVASVVDIQVGRRISGKECYANGQEKSAGDRKNGVTDTSGRNGRLLSANPASTGLTKPSVAPANGVVKAGVERTPTEAEQRSDDSTAVDATAARVVALLTVVGGGLVMLLGKKGPALLVAAAVQAACSVRLQSLSGDRVCIPERGQAMVDGDKGLPASAAQNGTGTEVEGDGVGKSVGGGAIRAHLGKSETGQIESDEGQKISLGRTSEAPVEGTGSGRSSDGDKRARATSCSARSIESPLSVMHNSAARLVGAAAAGSEWSIHTTQLFFCTGHRCAFDALQYTAAFVGFEGFSFARSGALLAANTFAAHILVAFGLPLLVFRRALKWPERADLRVMLGRVVLGYGLARALACLVTTGTVAILRRHLMVWSIFAPKFVFDSCSLLVTDILLAVIVVYAEAAFARAKRR
ncbi:phosphatidylinositol glycan class O [Klebsormidium nitens]|uniref:Phosphatidylinositol glycan class O n=1 Tax=Klebsormidium nitens TaxID=105231 RepID=A0A1Y1HU71_KLENI|nr:phosphatidylinositol glycan class O [Klebsormidium nitens]|eukprot:GAQ80076.1 phosphatidylinositol glycan class O [Klebsormidium nitens]